MSTTIDSGSAIATDEHGHDDHDHPPFLAHHFETPEQQFDSGKLGIWLFLTQEVLFFSGMFCAYAVFRALRPEVFEGCSQFLNTQLGAINTCVLLFSSLTMALAVRCAQVEDHKNLVRNLTLTLSCAMIFLGVKAIEYSHKWSMGLLPPRWYFYDPANPHPADQPPYLWYICLPFLLMTAGVLVWMVWAIVRNRKYQADVAKPLFLVCLSFFAGVYLGSILESDGGAEHAGEHHAAAHHEGDVAAEGHGPAEESDHADDQAAAEPPPTAASASDAAPSSLSESEAAIAGSDTGGDLLLELLATDRTNSGAQSQLEALSRQSAASGSAVVRGDASAASPAVDVDSSVHTKRRAGVFFSIYYCMTGIHALHIIGGIAALVWLLFRAVRNDFNRQYFGPVDYVGLYWHLVDLVWIYLFPLLYLIR